MTGMRRWRAFARRLVVVGLSCEVVVALAGLAAVVVAALGGGDGLPGDLVLPVVAQVGLVGVAVLAIRDARRRHSRRHAATARSPIE